KSQDEISIRRGYCDNCALSRFVLVFVEAASIRCVSGKGLSRCELRSVMIDKGFGFWRRVIIGAGMVFGVGGIWGSMVALVDGILNNERVWVNWSSIRVRGEADHVIDGLVDDRLRLPEELSCVHHIPCVESKKNVLADASLHVPLDEIKVDKTLRFVKEPIENSDREVKTLKCSRIMVVKVHLGSKRGPLEKQHDLSSKTPEKVLIREEAKYPVTKNVNSISLARGEEERSDKTNETLGNTVKPIGTETGIPVKEAEGNNETENKPIEKAEKEEVVEAPSSRPVEYYLKRRINKKLIEGLVDNPRGPVYDAILKKKITKKENIRGNFEIPCSTGGLKNVNALVDQGSNVNVMPYSTYMKLTDERPVETDIRLSLASHSYIYPLGIAEDVLVEVAEHVYPVDFMILDIKEDEKRPFILGVPFLTTTKAVIKFDKGTITLRSGKCKISFHRIPQPLCKTERGVKNDIEHIYPTMIVNRLVLEWEERIRLHQEKEMEFDQWRSKNFKNEHPALTKVDEEVEDDKGEVTLYLMRRSLEVLRKFHWMILGGRFNQLSHVSSPLLSKPGEY
ncbi:zinc finger, CCHC-type containing protein, partial [Tanacetum coccineum]